MIKRHSRPSAIVNSQGICDFEITEALNLVFNYSALALRQAGRRAGTAAWHCIRWAAQAGGKCPLCPALLASPGQEALVAGLRHLPSGARPPNPYSWGGVTAQTAISGGHAPPRPAGPPCEHPARGDTSVTQGVHRPSAGVSRALHRNTPLFSGTFSDCNLAAAC